MAMSLLSCHRNVSRSGDRTEEKAAGVKTSFIIQFIIYSLRGLYSFSGHSELGYVITCPILSPDYSTRPCPSFRIWVLLTFKGCRAAVWHGRVLIEQDGHPCNMHMLRFPASCSPVIPRPGGWVCLIPQSVPPLYFLRGLWSHFQGKSQISCFYLGPNK